ncbi:DMT family transporter [Alkaliphilus sp. MSJ-5]|uniref:DMT family transporter n=1 Tax=Alkaliphilus flagellatus TaxID=2841507 RepID=A0ABS6FZ10_9FIRM|nr:DMT family transporter [Alkaliphilus flagellatus]MBU5675303.1 DMT family transporter [Alkaliphilus flagellatus]
MKKIKIAYLSAIANAIIVGLSFIFMKIALIYTDPLNILAHRFTVSFITISIPILLRWIKLNIGLEDIKKILPLSIFYPALFFAFQSFGLSYISSSEAGIIHATIPIITLILATFVLKEKTTLLEKISVFLSVGGVVYIFLMKGINFKSSSFIGIVLIFLSAISSSSYNVLARKIVQKYKFIDVTYVMIFIGFISFNLLSIVDRLYKGDLKTYFSAFSSQDFLISILYLGILSSVVTSLLSNYALSIISAPKMSVFNNLSTLVTVVAGVLLLNETLYYYHIIGIVSILIGVLGTNLDKLRKDSL